MATTTWRFEIDGTPHMVSLTHRGWSSKRVIRIDDAVSVKRQRFGIYKGSRDVFAVDGTHELGVQVDVPSGYIGYNGETSRDSLQRYMREGPDGTSLDLLYELQLDGETLEPALIERLEPAGKAWHWGAGGAAFVLLLGLTFFLETDATATEPVQGARHSCTRGSSKWNCRLSYEFAGRPYDVRYTTTFEKYDGKEDTREFFVDPEHPENFEHASGPQQRRIGSYFLGAGLIGTVLYVVRLLSRRRLRIGPEA